MLLFFSCLTHFAHVLHLMSPCWLLTHIPPASSSPHFDLQAFIPSHSICSTWHPNTFHLTWLLPHNVTRSAHVFSHITAEVESLSLFSFVRQTGNGPHVCNAFQVCDSRKFTLSHTHSWQVTIFLFTQFEPEIHGSHTSSCDLDLSVSKTKSCWLEVLYFYLKREAV